MKKCLFSLGALLAPIGISYANASAAASSTLTSPFSGFAQMVFGVLVVLAIILGLGWMVRRLSVTTPSNRLRLVGGVMVGSKERVLIVEVEQDWLVLGVTQHQINLLSKYPKPENVGEIMATDPSFVSRLKQFMNKRP